MIKKQSVAAVAARVGVCAAVIECGKLALAALPNIEVVTLLVALFSYVFGWSGVLSAVIFVLIEPIIWGFGPWVISYFIYWPIVAVLFCIYGRLGVRSRVVISASAILLTVFFGFLTSLVDMLFFSQSLDSFFVRFWAYYIRGALFYALQICCNAVLFFLIFGFLADKISAIGKKIK